MSGSGIQMSIKLLIEDVENLHRLMQDPSLSLQGEEFYTDYFFDCASRLLKLNNDVLRLRVPITREGDISTTRKKKFISLALKNSNKVESGDQMCFANQVLEVPEHIKNELVSGGDLMEVLKRHYPAPCSPSMNRSTECDSAMHCIMQKLESLQQRFNVQERIELVGSLKSHRRIYKYTPHHTQEKLRGVNEESLLQHITIRLDETEFPFGTKYEIELTDFSFPAHDVWEELEEFLQSCHIKYSKSLESKSSRFMKYLDGLKPSSVDKMEVNLSILCIQGYNEVLTWLENDCKTVDALPVPSCAVEGAEYFMSQASAVNEYFSGRKEQRPIISSLQQVSQSIMTQENNYLMGYNEGRNRRPLGAQQVQETDENNMKEEYHENYYFDDSLEGTLMRSHCMLELRCMDEGEAFILSLKKDQTVTNGSQLATTLKSEISGDMARLLLRNPSEFLNSMREYSNIASALWCEFGLRELCVTAFYRTKRRIFTRSITANVPSWVSQNVRHGQMSDDDDVYMRKWNSHMDSFSQSIMDRMPVLRIFLDWTVYDFSMPAYHFSAVAAENSSCTYGSAASFASLPSSTTSTAFNYPHQQQNSIFSSYSVGITATTSDMEKLVKPWLINNMNTIGVEWSFGNMTKVEQYVNLLLEQQRCGERGTQRQEENYLNDVPYIRS